MITFSQRYPTCFPNLLLASLLVGSFFLAAESKAAGPRYWNVKPYRVQIDLIPSGTLLSENPQTEAIRKRLQELCKTRLRPFWTSHVHVPAPNERKALIKQLDENLPSTAPAEFDTTFESPDKRLLLQLEQQGSILRARCREYDTTVERWSLTQELELPSLVGVEEALLQMLLEAFSPLVAFDLDPQDLSIVSIQIRAKDLMVNEKLGNPKPGTILLPFLRRIDREGNPIADGLSQVDWTYLLVPDLGISASDTPSNGSTTSNTKASEADVYSHLRLPFGSRRRGRVQQLAIAVQHDPTLSTKLQLHAQQDKTIPLEGYQVFLGKPGDGSNLIRIGRTDQTGSITIPAANEIQMIHIKSGSTVVASLPIASGVNPLLTVPLLDERQRLAAESKVSAMREQLVDLVAQRKILISRIRRRIEVNDIKTAEALLNKLKSLPGQAQFSQQLDQAEQFYRADHPLVQRRLDRLFAQTRSVLGSSLDARETRRIADEVIQAKQASKDNIN